MWPIRRPHPPFLAPCWRLFGGSSDGSHRSLACPLQPLSGQFGQDVCKYAHVGSSSPSVVKCLVWPIIGRSIAPAQAIPNDVDDAAENAAIIDTRNTPRLREQSVECVSGVLREARKDATWKILLPPLNHDATNNGIGHSNVRSAWNTGRPTKTVR